MNNEFYLLNKVPQVLRAKGFRLYTDGGQRLVDLWLNGGAAVLGHTPANMLRELKNTANRGLYAPYPHFTESRFLKALSKLFPNSKFRLYAAPPPELITLFKNGTAKFWRPFAQSIPNGAENEKKSSLLIPVLSGIQTWREGLPLGLCVVVYNEADDANGKSEIEKLFSQLPTGDILSPILFAIATRGVHDLITSSEKRKPLLTKVTESLQNSQWKQNGIYLTLKEEITSKEWESLFDKFLKAGFLLPPIQCHPLILPADLSAGEEAKLIAVLES